MISERPIDVDHQCEWACLERKSPQGELATLTPLTKEAVNLIQKDPTKIEKVCPHGVVVCAICSKYFNDAQKLKDPRPALGSLAPRLIQIRKPATPKVD